MIRTFQKSSRRKSINKAAFTFTKRSKKKHKKNNLKGILKFKMLKLLRGNIQILNYTLKIFSQK